MDPAVVIEDLYLSHYTEIFSICTLVYGCLWPRMDLESFFGRYLKTTPFLALPFFSTLASTEAPATTGVLLATGNDNCLHACLHLPFCSLALEA